MKRGNYWIGSVDLAGLLKITVEVREDFVDHPDFLERFRRAADQALQEARTINLGDPTDDEIEWLERR